MTNNKNKLGLFSSARSRLVAAIVIALAVIAVIVSVLVHMHHESIDSASASLGATPNIESIPGQTTTSTAYNNMQNALNNKRAVDARHNATSSVPTITRPGVLGDLSQFADSNANTNKSTGSLSISSHDCPLKTVVMFKPNPASCLPQNLKLARKAGVTAEELRCQGCSCPSLKLAGYTVGELRTTGYEATELKRCGFTLGQLVAAGYSAAELKAAGYSANDLMNDGFTAGQLKSAGYSAADLHKAGLTNKQLLAAGFSPAASTLCNPSALKRAHDSGVSATTLRAKGCGLAALKSSGYSAAQLRKAGFNAADLKQAGFPDSALAAAGFSANQIKRADEASKMCNINKLKQERNAGISAVELKKEGCGVAALKAAGFTAAELRSAGFSAKQLKDAGFTAKQLHDAGYTASALKAAGFNAKQLHAAGFSAGEVKQAGFSAAALQGAGYSAGQLKAAGFNAAALRNAGFSAGDLKNAGFSAATLKKAGFGAGQLQAAGYNADALKHAGFTAAQLHDAGFGASDLKAAGFSAAALKKAGYTGGDLLRGGFTAKQAGVQASLPAQPAIATQAAIQQAVNKALAARAQKVAGPSVTTGGVVLPSVSNNTVEGRMAAIERSEQQQMGQQERAQAIQQEQAAMTQQVQSMMTEWNGTAKQQSETAEVQPAQTAATAGVQNTAAGTTSAKGSSGQDQNNGGPVIKAGTIMFAVLDTSINTDEATPIMARIVSGPLKGSKLLGTFVRVNKKVMLKFNILNSPAYTRTIPINAVAIDPDTARTAMSGNVNNHYLLRYGSLFASAFLEGYSQALTSTADSQSCQGSVVCNVTASQSPLNTGQKAVVALGKVGSRYSTVMAGNFSTPPTVRVPGGSGFGLLIMNDLQLPEQQPALN